MMCNGLRWKKLDALKLQADPGLGSAWNRLNADGCDLPFMAAHSIAAALREFGTGRECLCIATVDGAIIAMAVVAPIDSLRWTLFQPSQLPLGPLVRAPGHSLEEIAAGLLRKVLPPWTASMSFTQLDSMCFARGEGSPTSHFDDYIETAWLELDGSFEEYWASRGKNLRQNLRKQRSKLNDEDVATTLLFWREPHQITAAVERFAALEGTGWKASNGTAVQVDNAQGRYYARLLETAAAQGEALLTEYRFGDRTVAMNLGLLRNGVWTVLKTAYDETVSKSLSPASLLREDELKLLFARREVRRIEYFGRIMEWHTKLTDHRRTLFHYTAFRWSWVKRIAMVRRERGAKVAAGDSPADSA